MKSKTRSCLSWTSNGFLPLAIAQGSYVGRVFFLVIMLHGTVLPAENSGHIQLIADPGLKIFLNGSFKGVTKTDDKGLVIMDVPVGHHIIRVTKDGYTPRESQLEVLNGQVVELRIDTLLAHKSAQAGEATEKADPADAITTTPVFGQNWSIPGVGIEMISIPNGEFIMGEENKKRKVHPRVKMTRDFWMSKTEITQSQWMQLMAKNPSSNQGPFNPVEMVSRTDAMQFCVKLTQREASAGRLPKGYVYTLPTIAEWEYSCRAGTVGKFSEVLDSVAWYKDNSNAQSHPVGAKQPNKWGLYDMLGNVGEWTFDSWLDDKDAGPFTDPIGPRPRRLLVAMGGAWSHSAATCLPGIMTLVVTEKNSAYGFRIVLCQQR